MRLISLTQGKSTIVDDSDFEELSKFKWYFHQGRAVRHPRIADKKRTGMIWMHREVAKPRKDKVVDHINGNTLDNRRVNLRICTRSQNQWNKSLNSKSFTGLKNIHWKKARQRYVVSFQKYGKKIYFGYYKDIDEAIASRNKAAMKVHRGFNPILELSSSTE